MTQNYSVASRTRFVLVDVVAVGLDLMKELNQLLKLHMFPATICLSISVSEILIGDYFFCGGFMQWSRILHKYYSSLFFFYRERLARECRHIRPKGDRRSV